MMFAYFDSDYTLIGYNNTSLPLDFFEPSATYEVEIDQGVYENALDEQLTQYDPDTGTFLQNPDPAPAEITAEEQARAYLEGTNDYVLYGLLTPEIEQRRALAIQILGLALTEPPFDIFTATE